MSETPKYEPPFIDRVKWYLVESGWLPHRLHRRWQAVLFDKLDTAIFGESHLEFKRWRGV
ncbi:MAG TPA: hypothetical protein VND94_00785 [Terriglobia bacterium]|nr:hypothetical protein [Terriglobia bacterium]